MVERLFVIDTDPFDFLSDGLDELSESLSDMRPLFEGFASDFYKDEKRIFSMKTAGRWGKEDKDLSPKYKTYKEKKKGSAYPILLFDGDLARSLLRRNAPGSSGRGAGSEPELRREVEYGQGARGRAALPMQQPRRGGGTCSAPGRERRERARRRPLPRLRGRADRQPASRRELDDPSPPAPRSGE